MRRVFDELFDVNATSAVRNAFANDSQRTQHSLCSSSDGPMRSVIPNSCSAIVPPGASLTPLDVMSLVLRGNATFAYETIDNVAAYTIVSQLMSEMRCGRCDGAVDGVVGADRHSTGSRVEQTSSHRWPQRRRDWRRRRCRAHRSVSFVVPSVRTVRWRLRSSLLAIQHDADSGSRCREALRRFAANNINHPQVFIRWSVIF